MHDAFEEATYTCDPRVTDFRAGVRFDVDVDALEAECESENEGDTCAVHLCMCEMNLINGLLDLVWSSIGFDASFQHPSNGGTFDYESNCPQLGIGSETSCCGRYPYRIPYSLDGSRACCEADDTLYSELAEQCCSDGVQELGDLCT